MKRTAMDIDEIVYRLEEAHRERDRLETDLHNAIVFDDDPIVALDVAFKYVEADAALWVAAAAHTAATEDKSISEQINTSIETRRRHHEGEIGFDIWLNAAEDAKRGYE